MDEIVALVMKKTGLPKETAQAAIKVVLDFLKKKLPAPVGQASMRSSAAKVKWQSQPIYSVGCWAERKRNSLIKDGVINPPSFLNH